LQVGETKFNHCWPPWKNMFGHHMEKSTMNPSGKSPSDAHARLCVDQGFLNVFEMSTYPSNRLYHFCEPSSCWCNDTIVQI